MSLEDARRLVAGYVEHYNEVRLHNAIGFVTPKDKFEGRDSKKGGGHRKHLHITARYGKLTSRDKTEAGYAGEQPAKG